MLLAALLTMAVLVVALGSSTTATDGAGDPVPAQMVTVQPGDTLWKLATEANPNGDIRQTVDDIMRLNSLDTAHLPMGERGRGPDLRVSCPERLTRILDASAPTGKRCRGVAFLGGCVPPGSLSRWLRAARQPFSVVE